MLGDVKTIFDQNLQSVLDTGNTSTTAMNITAGAFSTITNLYTGTLDVATSLIVDGTFVDSAGVTNDGTKVLGSTATGNPLWVADSDNQNLQSVLDFGNTSTTEFEITSGSYSTIELLGTRRFNYTEEFTANGVFIDSASVTNDGTKFLGSDVLGNPLWLTVPAQIPNLTQVLNATDFTAQEPSLGIFNAIQVTFGSASGTVSDPVMLDALGNITFNEAGTYFINGYASIDRTGPNGGVAVFLYRYLLDGVQVGYPIALELDRSNISIPEIQAFPLTITTPGTVLTYEIARTGTVNQGGLYPYFTNTSWGNSPSAAITISKLG